MKPLHIYILFMFATMVLFFIKYDWSSKLKRILIIGHIVCLILVVINTFLVSKYKISIRGNWTDSLLILGLLISGAMIFALYRKSLKTGFYYGMFFFYPFVTGLAYLINKIMFVVLMVPLIMTDIQDNYYSDKKFDIRNGTGFMGPKQLVLVEKFHLLEAEIGRSEYLENGEYKSFKIITENDDSIQSELIRNGKLENMIFLK